MIAENRRLIAAERGRALLHAAMSDRLPPSPGDAYREDASEGLGRQVGLFLLYGSRADDFNWLGVLRGVGQAIGESLRHPDNGDTVAMSPVFVEEIEQGIAEGLGARWKERPPLCAACGRDRRDD